MSEELRPIRFAGHALELLDQTRLPAEEAWLRCERVEQVADAIRRLSVRGAPAIGIAAAYGLALAAREGRPFDEAADLLASTRPTAVNLRWAIERARPAASGGAEALVRVADEIAAEQDAADRALSEHGAALLAEGERVLTHCNAGALATGAYGTALGVIRTAFEQGRVGEVFVDETRPLLQGSRLTAWELDRLGIPYRVVPDAGVGALMARGLVDRVLVGADRIAANGDVANKIGTYTVAVCAARHGVPVVVAAPWSTVDLATPSGGAIPIEERDPAEVLSAGGVQLAPEAAAAANWAFDVTPAELVGAIVTERGVHVPPYGTALGRATAAAVSSG